MSETFSISSGKIGAIQGSGGTLSSISSSATNFDGGATLSYDAATGGYTVYDGSSGMNFLPASKDNANSNVVITVYKVDGSGGRQDQLVLFNPGSANLLLALSYVSYGTWATSNASTGAVEQRYFVYGIRQGASQPSTGSASYVTNVDGLWATNSGGYALTGNASFTANFSNMTVATDLNLTGTHAITSQVKSLGIFRGSGSIAAFGGGFNGTFVQQGTDADGNVYSGNFNGAFFGPTGSEIGYTFRLTGANGVAVGAVVGKAQ